MNALIFCYTDNGGQGIALCDALNKYTMHTARCVTVNQTYLGYKTDICLSDGDEVPDNDFDFYIMSEYLPTMIKDTDILSAATPKNTIIRTGGSVVRKNLDYYADQQRRKGWMYAGGYHDSSLSEKIVIARTTNILPIDEMPIPRIIDDEIRVAFAPTKKVKGVDEFAEVMTKLESKFDNVTGVPIIGKSWKESIAIKATCNVTFDQFLIPTYGNSAIESMYLEHRVLSKIDWWTRMLYPDLPILSVDSPGELYGSLKRIISQVNDDQEFLLCNGAQAKEFVNKYHTPEVVARQWYFLMNHVSENA